MFVPPTLEEEYGGRLCIILLHRAISNTLHLRILLNDSLELRHLE
jgi:hypothetical protein